MIELKFDQNKLIRLFREKNLRFFNSIEQAFKFASQEYIAYMVRRYYSGRQADDTGLNRKSGRLAGGWYEEVTPVLFQNVSARIYNAQAPYGLFHDLMHKVAPGNRRMPIRTFIGRDLKSKTIGVQMFVNRIKIALGNV